MIARQFEIKTGIDITGIMDPEFVKEDPCLNCTLPFECDESHPNCAYQNALPQRTIAIDSSHILALLPVAIRRQKERRRQTWVKAQQRKTGQQNFEFTGGEHAE
jgi:hypothetical protein